MSKRHKALEDESFPPEYQEFMKKESKMVIEFVKDAKSLLDIGCGEGRAMDMIAPIFKGTYLGVDVDKEFLSVAEITGRKYPNMAVKFCNAELLETLLGSKSFHKSILLWNTLGNVKNDRKVLEQAIQVTKEEILIGVMAKGAVSIRKKYYDMLEDNYTIDTKTETFHSDIWGTSRSYSPDEIKQLCNGVGLKVEQINPIGQLGLCVIASCR